MNAELRDLARHVVRWRKDPPAFCREILGVNLWQRQREILYSIRDNRRTAVPSCHESGKTFVAACAVVHHLVCYQPSKVITTAPSQRQVEKLLWGNVGNLKAKMDRRLGGEIDFGRLNMTEWKVEPDWFAFGFATTADNAAENATRFQGYHSPHILVILDEAAGIERPIWDAVDGLMTSQSARLLVIGNPTDPSGAFARACQSAAYRVIRISAFDCPNLQPGAKQGEWGVSPEWIEDMRRQWGESSGMYMSRVLGLFPSRGTDNLIGSAEVELAIERTAEAAEAIERAAKEREGLLDAATLPVIGCDVARFGDDDTVIYVLRGNVVLHAESWSGQDTMKTAGRLIALAREHGLWTDNAHRIAVDDTGVGGGVVDRLHEQGWMVEAVNFGSKPRESRNEEKFTNRRMELWWDLREWLRGGASLAGLSPDTLDVLRSDLCAPKYEQKSDGRIALEPKDKIKERIGRSPDHGDALALAVAVLRAPPPLEEEPKPAPDEDEDEPERDWRDEAVVRTPPVW